MPPEPTPGPLTLRGVTVRPGGDLTLHYPDLTLPPGAQLAITGPSGTGKSTLLHVLAGLIRPAGGEVSVAGHALHTLPERALARYRRAHVGYMFQDFHLMPGLTALENVQLGLRVAGQRAGPAEALGALRRVDLAHRAAHRPSQLSTGERQRVALARAAAHRPALLLVDEPTAHLDLTRAAQALSLLHELSADLHATLILVTHDPAVAATLPRQLHLTPPGHATPPEPARTLGTLPGVTL